MTLKIRKLLPIEEDHNPSVLSLSHYSPTHSPSKNYQREDNPTTSNYYNNLKLNPPFDSAMALTVLVLLTALFFMGFFSIYIRRFSDEPSVDPTRRRRSSSSSQRDGSLPLTTSYSSRTRDSARGVDAKVVKALPVHAYFPGEGKQGMMIDEVECAICLSEFEEKELIKEIPYCGHVFHVECIDTWLESHVTCPLCRTAKLLVEEEEEKIKIEVVAAVAVEVVEGGGSVGESSGSSGGSEVRLVVEGGDTWNEERREVGSTTGDERRSTSCVWFGERVRLHRSLSF